MFQNNLKIAFRSLLRRRTFSVINIVGLALGMTAAIFAFLWVQNEMSFNRYHQNADQIYRINTDLTVGNGDVWQWTTTPFPLEELMKSEMPEVVRTVKYYQNSWKPFTLKKDATLLHSKRYACVGQDWFDLFDHEFLHGSAEGFQQQLRSAIMTRDFTERLFGRLDVVGEMFEMDSMEFVVQAVIQNPPPNSSITNEMFLPMSYYETGAGRSDQTNWDNFNYLTFVQLRPEANLENINDKLTALINKNRTRNNAQLFVQPLSEVYFDEDRNFGSMLTGSRQTVYTVGIIGFIILFLACVNYVSLTTAQAGTRTKEVGVRKIIGAKGGQIFKLVFTESVLMSVIAMVLALCVVQLALPFFNQFTAKTFQLDPTNSAIWMVSGGTLLVTLLLSGIYPAMFLTGFTPGSFLRGQSFLKLKNTAFRKGLVISQFTITVGLIIGAMVMVQQQDFIHKKDLGFDRSQVFEMVLPYSPKREAMISGIRQSLSNAPSVIGTAAANSSIIDIQSTHSGSLDWTGKPEDFVPTVNQMSVDLEYGELMELPLADGRWFQPNNEADANNVVLNETAIKYLQLPEPVVGQTFHFHGSEGRVIGVLKDFHFQNLRKKIEPLVLYLHPQSLSTIAVKTSKSQTTAALAAASDAWATHNPGQPFEYHFLDDAFDKMYHSEQQHAGLFKMMAGLAIFISCLGLFGLAVFSTQQRTKEIGIRKVLGASVAGLVGLLSLDFLKLVLVALLIASPLAYFLMDNWLQDFAYRISIEWWVFALAGIMAIGVAFLTVSFQSVKAALANPVESLRSE